MYKLTWISPAEIPNFQAKYGSFNDFPPNWHEISEEEFARSSFFIYGPIYQGSRQMCHKRGFNEPYTEARLYFLHDGTGYALERDLKNKKIHYYKFAFCEHEYGPDQGRQRYIHIFVCKKCGYRLAYDSSD